MVAKTAAQSIVRQLLQDATMRSGELPESAKHVNVTCADDTTMNEDKQGLQRDVTEVDVSRRGAVRTCLMIVMMLCRRIWDSGWS